MTGDYFTGGETGTTSNGGAGGQPSYVGGQYYGGHRGAMLRGLYEQQAALLVRQIRSTQTAANIQNAIVFSHVPRGAPAATVQTNISSQVTQLVGQLAQVGSQFIQARNARIQQKKRAHLEAALTRKIIRAQNRAAVPQYQQIALTGLNMGPPIPGATYY